MGPAAFAAWKDGAVQLSDFAGAYTDPLYGRMVCQRSLKDILGDDAKK